MIASTRQLDEPVLPTEAEVEVAKDSSRQLAAIIGKGDGAHVFVIDGQEEITVPLKALRMLERILAQMARGNAISLVPVKAMLTTQKAADLLNVSRPFIIGLIEKGDLVATQVGTHRRIKLEDVLAYRERSRINRSKILDEMTREDQESGDYE